MAIKTIALISSLGDMDRHVHGSGMAYENVRLGNLYFSSDIVFDFVRSL